MWGELSSEWGELSSQCGASCLGASFLWGELFWGELSLGGVVRNPRQGCLRWRKATSYDDNLGISPAKPPHQEGDRNPGWI